MQFYLSYIGGQTGRVAVHLSIGNLKGVTLTLTPLNWRLSLNYWPFFLCLGWANSRSEPSSRVGHFPP